jgi:hypothetical protein
MLGAVLPAIVVRVLEGRSGSTMLLRLLASSPNVVLDRRYPEGEYRYLSYCVRAAEEMLRPWDPERDPGVTSMFFEASRPFGPLPFNAESLDRNRTQMFVTAHLWEAFSAALREGHPDALLYAEKVAVPLDPLLAAGVPLRVIDCVRDPRDILASVRDFTARTGVDGFGRSSSEDDSAYVRTFASQIQRRAVELEAELPAETAHLTVRYEDIVLDVGGFARHLSSWLDIELDAAAVAFDPADPHITSRSVKESIGRWRTDLKPGEAEALVSLAEPVFRRYGYGP